jgi:hypothetical protein
MSDKFYVVHVLEEDYFFTIARSRKEAIRNLQRYCHPITDGLDKLYVSVKGFSLNELKQGRHFEYYKSRIKLEEEKKRCLKNEV